MTDDWVDYFRTQVLGLSPRPRCADCGGLYEEEQVYDWTMYEVTDSWYCETCDKHVYREDSLED